MLSTTPTVRTWLAVLLLLLCAGTPWSAGAVPVDPPLTAADAAIPWRWIGVKTVPADDCPVPVPSPGLPPWQVRQLFDPGDGSPIPPGLLPFCLYEREKPADLAALQALVGAGLTAVETDDMVVGRAGGDLQDATWQIHRDRFLTHAGAVPPAAGTAPQTRLAVVDTGATRDTDPEHHPGSSPHGYTLVNMARELLCAGGDCAADVVTRLALAYRGFDPESRELSERDEVDGGYLGTLGELAEAVRGEVRAWQGGTAKNLVLNLSMAWHPRFGGLESRLVDMPVAVRAVHRALDDAVCRGAVAVAAAGNVGGGPGQETGPLLPAAWEARPAPDAGACLELLGAAPDPALFPPAGTAAYRPLVHAAGGVRADGHPLANARPGSAPRLAAFADHGTAASPSGDPTALLTGSSVATLVTSAAAAAVWHHGPALRADQVMAIVHDAGDDLGRAPDFCLGSDGGPCPDPSIAVRRVSACAAVARACTGGKVECPKEVASLVCPEWPAEPPELPAAVADGFPSSAILVDLDEVTAPYPPVPECEGEALRHPPNRPPVDPCPHHQYHGLPAEPWTGPQPGSDPCPACWLDFASAGTLYLEIDSRFEGTLTDATLVVGTETYNLGLGPLRAGDRAVIVDVPIRPDPTIPVTVAFTLDASRSATSTVLTVER